MKKKILLTGANGFVGIQILKNLLLKDVELTVIIRSQSVKKFKKSKKIKKIIESSDMFSESIEWWKSKCKGIDIVIHSAWYVKPPNYQSSEKNLDCLIGTLKMAEGCIKAGVKKFVGIGSCAEYDYSQGLMSIDTILNPTSLYAKSKVSTFLTLSNWFKGSSITFCWCRLFYLYGEGEHPSRLYPSIIKNLSLNQQVPLTEGSQVRDFLNVKEAGLMIADIALSFKDGAINICSGKPITIREFAEKIANKFGRIHLLKFGEIVSNEFDPPYIVGKK